MRTAYELTLLRKAIDDMPVLFSARITGDHQAIVNEVNASMVTLGKPTRVTLEDVRLAMDLYPVEKPKNLRSATVQLVGAGAIR